MILDNGPWLVLTLMWLPCCSHGRSRLDTELAGGQQATLRLTRYLAFDLWWHVTAETVRFLNSSTTLVMCPLERLGDA